MLPDQFEIDCIVYYDVWSTVEPLEVGWPRKYWLDSAPHFGQIPNFWHYSFYLFLFISASVDIDFWTIMATRSTDHQTLLFVEE